MTEENGQGTAVPSKGSFLDWAKLIGGAIAIILTTSERIVSHLDKRFDTIGETMVKTEQNIHAAINDVHDQARAYHVQDSLRISELEVLVETAPRKRR